MIIRGIDTIGERKTDASSFPPCSTKTRTSISGTYTEIEITPLTVYLHLDGTTQHPEAVDIDSGFLDCDQSQDVGLHTWNRLASG